jgi:hypothetical protein
MLAGWLESLVCSGAGRKCAYCSSTEHNVALSFCCIMFSDLGMSLLLVHEDICKSCVGDECYQLLFLLFEIISAFPMLNQYGIPGINPT